MQNWKIYLAFLAIYLIGGATNLAAYFGLNRVSSHLLSAFRYLVAGWILFSRAFFGVGALPNRDSLKGDGFAGPLMLTGGSGSVLWAQQYIGSGLAAILLSSLRLWFVIFGRKNRINFNTVKLAACSPGCIHY